MFGTVTGTDQRLVLPSTVSCLDQQRQEAHGWGGVCSFLDIVVILDLSVRYLNPGRKYDPS